MFCGIHRTEFSHYPNSDQEKPGRPIKDYLVDYRGSESIGRGEVFYKESIEEIKSFFDYLLPEASDLPKGVTISSAEISAVTYLLTKRVKSLYWIGRTELDEKSKALIGYLCTALQGPLPAIVAEDVKKNTLYYEKTDGKREVGAKGEQKDDEHEAWMSKASDNAKEAELAVVELLERLARETKGIDEGQEEDDGMYPFYVFEEDEQYKDGKDVPAPKVRAGDVIEVTASKDLAYFDFVIKAGTAIR